MSLALILVGACVGGASCSSSSASSCTVDTRDCGSGSGWCLCADALSCSSIVNGRWLMDAGVADAATRSNQRLFCGRPALDSAATGDDVGAATTFATPRFFIDVAALMTERKFFAVVLTAAAPGALDSSALGMSERRDLPMLTIDAPCVMRFRSDARANDSDGCRSRP